MLYFIVVLLAVIVSTVLYNSIEIPFQKIGKKIIARLEAKESAA
jgi:peptidoglycan/LPS O-acetylase OafA/YrhL